jgi:hypothetical protein
MGCDYYIHLYVEIQYISGVSKYQYATIRGFYSELDCGIYDSDDEECDYYYHSNEYKKLYEDMVKLSLTPRKSIVIYENGSFKSPHFENKFKMMIENILSKKDIPNLNHFEEITKITKIEERYEPSF